MRVGIGKKSSNPFTVSRKVNTCVNLVGEYLHKDSFPDFDGGNNEEKLVRLAQQGRVLMKRFDELLKKYPQESSEQIYRAGGWRMV